jgi:Glycosyltransferase family 87
VTRAVFIALAACAILLLSARAAVTIRDADVSDFRCFYESGRLVRVGLDPYDQATWAAATMADPARLPPCPRTTYAYPLWTAVAFAPLSLLPEQSALALWEVILLASAVSSVALLARAGGTRADGRLLLLLVLWSQPMFSAIANAQLGPVILVSLSATALALERGHERAAAMAAWLLLLKPNMVLLVLAGLPLLRSRRFAAYAIGGALAILLGTLLLIPTWPLDLAGVIFGQQLLVDRGLSTLWSLAADLGLPSVVGAVVSLLACVALLASLRGRPLRATETVAVLVAASFLITPYTRPHDQIALAICWAAALSRGVELRSMVGWVVIVALVLPWTVTLLTQGDVPLSLYSSVSVASAAVVAYSLRSHGRAAVQQPLG